VIAAAARLAGPPDAAALERLQAAIVRIGERHEALRLSFHPSEDGPVQRLRPAGEPAVDLLEVDATGWSPERLRAWLDEEAWRPFDLERDPLLRVRLLHTGNDPVLLLSIHHLVADLGSLAVIARDIGLALTGCDPPPAPRFTDQAGRQRRLLEGDRGERLARRWLERLDGAPTVCELPTDRRRPATRDFRGGSCAARLGPDLTNRLRRLAADRGATLFPVLLAGFQALLHRITGQTDLLLGAPASGRSRETEDTVGYFVNPVVLRSRTEDDPAFGPFVDRARGALFAALRDQAFPFPWLVERLQPERDPSRSPVFQVMVAFQRARLAGAQALADLALGQAGEEVRIGPLALRPLPLERRFAQLDLELAAAETETGLDLTLTYDADLFDPATAERLLGHLGVLLAAGAERPDLRVAELPLLNRAEIRQLLLWNRTGSPEPAAGVLALFRERAAATPEATAVSCGDAFLSYGELAERVDRLARSLAARLAPEEPVAVVAERGLELPVLVLAILAAGGVYLPLPPKHPEARLRRMVERSGARLVLRTGEPGSESAPLPQVTAENLAYLLFTSGSTGEPKGVMVPHRGLLNHLLAKVRDLGLGPGDRVAQTAGAGFDISIWQMLAPLLAGGTVEVIPDEIVADPPRLLEAVERTGVTVLEAVPSLLAALVDVEGKAAGLRWLISTGEALSPELARLCHERFPMARLLNAYGPTEAADRVSHALVAQPAPGDLHVPVGLPIANLRLHVLDRELRPLPVGVPGEIGIAGAGLARGYLGDPARTAEAFVPDPESPEPGERLYRSGDLGRRRPDGEIEVIGRLDHQVKVRGVRIEPAEIEAALAAHPGVREAVVALRGGRLVAWWTGEGTATDLREDLRTRLPEVMVPAAFVRLDALPRTPNGKLDRKALPDPIQEDTAGPRPFRDETEEIVAGIFAAVLGRDRVGPDESFFDLGGHSLLAAGVLVRVRSALGVEPPLATLFETPTAAGLAARIRNEAGAPLAPPLIALPRPEEIPLSFAQERLWFLQRLDPASPAYVMAGLVRLERPIGPEDLERVASRQEALRTVFPDRDGVPRQEIASGPSFQILDLSTLPDPEREARRLAREEARQPFDLARGPLLRATLLRLGEGEHRLLLAAHHIVADGASQEILLRELAGVHPDLPVQYADFALWQRQWMSGEVLEAELAWWRKELGTDLTPLELPFDRPRPARQRHRGARVPVRIPPLARVAGLTSFMVLLAAFQALLHRLTGQMEIRVGTPVGIRPTPETERLIGPFLNTLPLRSRLDGGPFLDRVRATCLGAFTHRDFPFERLVDELQPERDPSRAPLVQVMLALQPPSTTEVEEIDNGTAKLELNLSLREQGAGLAGWLEHDSDLFDRTTAQRIAASFLSVLDALVADPDRPVSELPLLDAAQRDQLVIEWNDTRAPIPETVVRAFAAQAARTPDAVALRAGDETLTYTELEARADRLARRLRSRGAGPEIPVGLCVERSAALVVGVLGILKSGGFYVPLDPAYPRERLAWMLEDTAAPLVVADAGSLAALPAGSWTAVLVDDLDDGAEALPEVLPESLAYTIFTSGSTGRPKGVQVPHRALANFLASMAWRPGLRPGDALLAVTTLSFDIAGLELLLPLITGARIELADRETALDGNLLAKAIERSGATAMQATPSTWRLLLDSGWTGAPGLTALCGGEALPPELARALRERTAALWNLYGPTETTIWSAVQRVDEDGPVPIGRPIANTSLHVVDAELRPAPVGVTGELVIGGVGVARGYRGRSDLTAERFVPDPFGDGERLYRTGDLSRRRADGALEWLGRLDQQVKVRGVRVEPGEIEAALAMHPAVARAVVAARDQRLLAWLVPAPGMTPAPAELRRFLADRLPAALVPSVFTVLETLPLTPNGKVDRRALPDPAPLAVSSDDPPSGPVEEAIAAIWSELLGVESVSRNVSFFELGGHSLLATRAMARLRPLFGIDLPLATLFEEPTVAGLARAVARGRSPRRPPAPAWERVPRTGPLAPSFAQERLWVMERLAPGNPVYHLAQALDVRGPLDEAALARSFVAVTTRHEALRTRFTTVHGKVFQVVDPPAPAPIPAVDLRALPAEARVAEADRLAREEARRPFDLRRGPLLRLLLLRLDEEERRLVVAVHHAVCDDASLGLLVREVTRGDALPAPAFQYADFAAWQRRWLQGDALEAEIEPWRRRLAGPLPVLAIPTDRPRPAVQSFRGALLPFAVPAPLAAAVRERALRHGATPFMALLAAFAAVLGRAAGQDDIILGTPVAGRGHAETEGMIGLFVNVLPLRIDLSESPSWPDLLARVKETALEAYDHQDVPFERLVEELQPRRDLGRAALRQAGIALQEVADRPIELSEKVTARPLALDPGVSRLDLTLFLRPAEGGLAGALEYATDLFDRATAARLADDFLAALEALAEDRPWPASRPLAAPRDAAPPETNLTEAQLLFWFAHRLNPDVQLYFDRASTVFTLEGDLDPEAFRQAFARLIETCDVLRSQVREVFGVPWRSVAEPGPESLEVLDLSGPPDPEGTFRRWLARRAQQPMDLADRLWDSALARTGPSRWRWFLSIHHLIVDAWTLQLLARRTSDLYERARRGTLDEAPALPSFEAYAAAEREARGSERYRRARDHWERKLARPAAENPFYRRAGAARETATERLSAGLDAATSARVRELASRLGLFSPSVVFATALLALLHRLGGERRLRLGTPFANRSERFRDTPGLMMNAAPLEVEVSSDLSFAALARAVQRETVETARHQLYPVRNPAEGRAWDVYLNFQTVSFSELCGLPARFELLHSGHSPDHLSVQVSDFGATGLYRLDADFQHACFDADERERTLGHLRTLLGALLENPETALRDAPLLSPAERLQLAAFNATDEAFPRGLCLHHLVEAQIARTPGAVAVSAEEGELTYRELGDRARRLAAFLRAAGVRPDGLVGVCLERSLDLSVALLAILEAGAAYVPIDPGYPAERIAFLIEDAAVPVLLTQSRLARALPEMSGPCVVRLDAEQGSISAFPADPPTDVDESGLAYAIYTSGSTGRPKGAMVPHAGIVNRLLWMQRAYGLTPADRVLQKTPFSFDVSVWELFWPLIVGARLVMARPGGHRDPAYLAATIARERITTIHFVPSMLQAFLDQPALGPFPTLMRVLCSGEALPEPLRVRFHERIPASELHNLYGPTEASVDVTAWASDPRLRLPSVPIGRPISNVRLHVLGREGEPVPPGIPGELGIAGVALARGYHRRPSLTAERFVPDPFANEPGARLYRTGDLARWMPDGNLEFLGRIDHQVKIRGFRVELEEIETALAVLPGVREAVVTMREDRADLPGDHRRLVAYVVPEAGSAPNPSALRAALAEKLPDFMVPAAFVELASIPLTPSGKADRAALPLPDLDTAAAGDAAARPPETPLEWLIAGVCAEVLGVESVPVDADFFALGGNSLLATQVVTMLQEVLPIELDLRQVFEGPTVARLATTIEEGRSALGEPERRAMAEILAELGESLSSGGADPGSPG
jgi:amino acid adenylation domain-containing protein